MVEAGPSGADIAEQLSPKAQFEVAVEEARGLFEVAYDRPALKDAIRGAKALGDATSMKATNVLNPLVELTRDAMEHAIREQDIEGSKDFLEMREGFESTIARLAVNDNPPASPTTAPRSRKARSSMSGNKS